jgi:hypothetical protein
VSSPHLLILDGHSSHVTIEVVKRARAVGLHLLTLPSYCSHTMQPLDVAISSLSKEHSVSIETHRRCRTGTRELGRRF